MNSYLILSYSNLDELTIEVNQKWKEGWRPQGGLSVTKGTDGLIFLQAISREEGAETILLNSLTSKNPEHNQKHLSMLVNTPA